MNIELDLFKICVLILDSDLIIWNMLVFFLYEGNAGSFRCKFLVWLRPGNPHNTSFEFYSMFFFSEFSL